MSGQHGGRRKESKFNAPISKKSALQRHSPANVISTPVAEFYDASSQDNLITGKAFTLLERNRYSITYCGVRVEFSSMHDAKAHKAAILRTRKKARVKIVKLPKVKVGISAMLERS